jgi:hypothetical protein
MNGRKYKHKTTGEKVTVYFWDRVDHVVKFKDDNNYKERLTEKEFLRDYVRCDPNEFSPEEFRRGINRLLNQ